MFELPTPEALPDETIPYLPNPFTFRNNKRFMNPVRFRTNYVFLPAYLAVCVLCLGTGMVFMNLDEDRYWPVFLTCLAVMAIATYVLLRQVPATRKEEIETELARYDLDPSHFPQQERYQAQNELWDVVLVPTGLVVEGKHYYYSALQPTLVTSHHFNRIWVSIRFGSDPFHGVYVPLDGSIIRAIEEFGIPLTNREELTYLRKHTENAFGQIYNSGNFKIVW